MPTLPTPAAKVSTLRTVLIFACIKVLSSQVTQIRHSVGGTLSTPSANPVAHVAGKAVSLVQKVDMKSSKSSNQIVHQKSTFRRNRNFAL